MSSSGSAPQHDLMARLGFLLGRWEGEGWHQRGDAPRTRFRQREDVHWKLGGQLITVEGLGQLESDPSVVIHHAFTVLSYDADQGCYRWEAFSAGHRIETVLHVADSRFEWSMNPAPDITMRYRASVADDVWSETGEMLVDQRGPMTIMEMTLHRIASTGHESELDLIETGPPDGC